MDKIDLDTSTYLAVCTLLSVAWEGKCAEVSKDGNPLYFETAHSLCQQFRLTREAKPGKVGQAESLFFNHRWPLSAIASYLGWTIGDTAEVVFASPRAGRQVEELVKLNALYEQRMM